MSNEIKVGQVYKLVDASKDFMLAHAISTGVITFPDEGTVTIHSVERGRVDGQLMGCSHTEGMSAKPCAYAQVKGDFLAVQQAGVDSEAFELVEDVA